ncbi:MAG TPA: DUF3090 family protein [Candidatus Limnocylindrales bacterium]
MSRRIFSFDQPDRFVAGAVGQPGQRTFFLQAAKGAHVVSVALEKAQVAILAERLATLLLALRQRGVDIGEESLTGTTELAQPVVEEFRVGTLTLGWNPDDERVVIEARELGEDEELEEEESDEDEGEGEGEDEEVSAADALRAAIAHMADEESSAGSALDVVRVQLEPNQALRFASGALAVVQAGRPPCPMCGQPLEPTGHFCTRRNGYQN